MGVRILGDAQQAALYCSTSDVAFGPVFSRNDRHADADERAEAFVRWLQTCETWPTYEKTVDRRDARVLTDAGLQLAYSDWLAQEDAQAAREDAAANGDDDDLEPA